MVEEAKTKAGLDSGTKLASLVSTCSYVIFLHWSWGFYLLQEHMKKQTENLVLMQIHQVILSSYMFTNRSNLCQD